MAARFNLYILLKPFKGRIIKTYHGRPNKIVDVTVASIIVGTSKSPAGRPVPLEVIEDAIQTLLKDDEIHIHHESKVYRGSFVVGLLLELPGVEKDPNTTGAILRDRSALQRFLNADGV